MKVIYDYVDYEIDTGTEGVRPVVYLKVGDGPRCYLSLSNAEALGAKLLAAAVLPQGQQAKVDAVKAAEALLAAIKGL